MAIKFLNSVNADSGVLYVDADNNRVGIGTISPSSVLDVSGNILISGGDSQISFYAGSQAGYRLYRNSTTMVLRSDGSIKEDAGSRYHINTNGSERLRVDSNGNVGIGTTSPGHKLDVAGDINIPLSTSYLRFGGQLGIKKQNIGAMHFYAGTSSTVGGFDFATWNGSVYSEGSFVIRNNGNVGIGTSNPTDTLHLYDAEAKINFESSHGRTSSIQQGGGYFSINADNVNGVAINYLSSNQGKLSLFNNTTSAIALNANGTTYFNGGDVAIGGTATSGYKLFVSGNTYLAGTTNYIDGQTILRTSGATEVMRVASNGNIGIGTTSPAEKLHIYGTSVGIDIDGTTSSRVYYNRSGAYVWSTGLRSGDTKFHIFDERAGDRVVIDDSGNVGIGTTSPTQKLEVAGTILESVLGYAPNDNLNDLVGNRYFKSHTSTTNAPLATFGMGINLEFGPGNSMQLYSDRSSANALYMRKQSNSSWSNWIRIRDENQISDTDISNWDAGYLRWSGVGGSGDWNNINENSFIRGHVGTLNHPTELGDTFLSGIAAMYGADNGWQLASNRGSGTNLYHRHVSNGTWYSWKRILDSDDIYVNNSNGNIGIGTTSPANKLSVLGNANITGFLTVGDSSADTFTSTGNTYLATLGNNVGIGTTSPSEKLHVVGNVTANEYEYNDAERVGSKNWKYTASVGAGYYEELGQWRATEGNIVLRITVASSTGGHSGTAVYILQGGFNQAVDGWFELLPAFKGGGHGEGQDGWKVLWYDNGSYTYKLAVAVPSGLANKNLHISVELLSDPRGDTYYQYSALSTTGAIPSYSLDRDTSYSYKDLISNDTVTAQYDASNYTVLGYDSLDTYGGSQVFKTAGTERMRIATNGDVGIGTSSPSEKLNVAGNIRVANSGKLYLWNDHDSNYLDYRTWLASSSAGLTINNAAGHIKLIAGSNEVLRAETSGNVGIGTTSPGHKLDVGGSININNISYAYKINDLNVLSVSANYTNLHNPEGAISIYLGDSGDRTNYYDNNFHRFRTAGGSSDYMFINSNGNVGIGTTSPYDKLSVIGDAGLYGTVSGGIVTPASLKFFTSENNTGLSNSNKHNIGQITWTGKDGSQNTVGEYAAIRSYLIDSNNLVQGSASEGGQIEFSTFRHDVSTEVRVEKVALTINQLGLLSLPQYTAGYLKTDASGNVSVDNSTFATQTYVTDAIADLVDSAPATLDTLNELAAALGDDPNFATTVTNSIATKVPLSGAATISGVKTFETVTGSNEDWINSPISILERDSIGTGGNGSDIYSPNINFHWRNRVSRSIWMDATGDFHFGEYSSVGVPGNTGAIYVGGGNSDNWNTAYSWGDHSTQGYITSAQAGIDQATADTRYVNVTGDTMTGTLNTQALVPSTDSSYNLGNSTNRYLTVWSRYLNSGGNTLEIRGGGTTIFKQDNVERMRLNSAGLGIGTTSPAAKLQIDGHGSLDGEIRINASGDNTEFGLIRFVGDSSTYEKYLIAYNSAHVSQADEISLKNAGGDITLYTGTLGSSSEKVRIDTSGNVGIGTTNPIQKLQVAGSAYVNGGTLFLDTNQFLMWGNSNQGIKAVNDGSMSFRTGGSETVTMEASGRVGINTTLPVTYLHIAGGHNSARSQITYTHNGDPAHQHSSQLLQWVSEPGITYAGAGIGANINASGQHYGRYNNSLNYGVYLRFEPENGYSEFYTTTGDSGVAGGQGARVFRVGPTGNVDTYGDIRMNGGTFLTDDGVSHYVMSQSNLYLYSGSSNTMTLSANGNVGIGTTSPSQKLHVDGNIKANGSVSVTNIVTNRIVKFNGSILDDSSIYDNGNVGIGTTSPAAPLHVAPDSNYKVIKLGDDTVSHYKFTGQADHTLTLTCGSYYMAEVVITAAQSNGGTYNNLYIRGIWSNNHTSHHWDVLEEVGFMGENTVSITNDENDVSNSGKLEIVHDYVSGGSFLGMTVRVTDYNGTHSYTIS